VGAQNDRRVLLDPPDQIPRHRLSQPVRSHEYVDALRRLREEDRGLARRIAPADDDHLVVHALLRLHESRAVVNANAFEARKTLEQRSAILGTGCDQDGSRLHGDAVADLYRVARVLAVELNRAACDQDVRAELLRLRERPPRKCLA
jgi:hypothetical protein